MEQTFLHTDVLTKRAGEVADSFGGNHSNW
jgi:hypothetical protein